MNKPKPVCPVCRRLNCTNPKHQREPFGGQRQRKTARPDYADSAQRKRRKQCVDAWLDEHGFPLTDGTIGARCPQCGMVRNSFVADHVVPLAHGGSEDGALRVHCRKCSAAQGAVIANEQMRRGAKGRG